MNQMAEKLPINQAQMTPMYTKKTLWPETYRPFGSYRRHLSASQHIKLSRLSRHSYSLCDDFLLPVRGQTLISSEPVVGEGGGRRVGVHSSGVSPGECRPRRRLPFTESGHTYISQRFTIPCRVVFFLFHSLSGPLWRLQSEKTAVLKR